MGLFCGHAFTGCENNAKISNCTSSSSNSNAIAYKHTPMNGVNVQCSNECCKHERLDKNNLYELAKRGFYEASVLGIISVNEEQLLFYNDNRHYFVAGGDLGRATWQAFCWLIHYPNSILGYKIASTIFIIGTNSLVPIFLLTS